MYYRFLICGFPEIGQLKAGFKADFVVLDKNIFTIPSEDVDTVHVLQTFISGEKVYERQAEV